MGAAAASQGARSRGRPPGSKNKPKALVSQVQVDDFRLKVGPYVSRKDLDYLTGIFEGTEENDLTKNLDILLTLQFKALLPQLSEEISSGTLSKEATSRSSVVKELLAIYLQKAKAENKNDAPDQRSYIQNVFVQRIDSDRLFALIGLQAPSPVAQIESGSLYGVVDHEPWRADQARTVSDKLPERQVVDADYSEVETDRV